MNYPYLFSLAVRTNPFNNTSSPVVRWIQARREGTRNLSSAIFVSDSGYLKNTEPSESYHVLFCIPVFCQLMVSLWNLQIVYFRSYHKWRLIKFSFLDKLSHSNAMYWTITFQIDSYKPHRFVSQSFIAPQRLHLGTPSINAMLWFELHLFFWNTERRPILPHFLHINFPITREISWFSTQGELNSPLVLPHFLHSTFPPIPAISWVPEQGLPKSEVRPHAVHIVSPCNVTMLWSKILHPVSSIVVQDKNCRW